jgi:c-di-AMP phosphodiesterase-like protein
MNDDTKYGLLFFAVAIVVIIAIYAILLKFIVSFLQYVVLFLVVVGGYTFYDLFVSGFVADWKSRVRT